MSVSPKPSGPEQSGMPYSDKNQGPDVNFSDIMSGLTHVDRNAPRFRLIARRYFFFINGIIGKEGLKNYLETYYYKTTDFVCSHNHGNTFVFVKFDTNEFKERTNRSDDFSYLNKQFAIYTLKVSPGENFLKSWIKKIDPSYVEEAKKDSVSVFEQIRGAQNPMDVLKQCTKPGDVSGLMQAYNLVRETQVIRDNYITGYKPWGWHSAVLNVVNISPEERDIWWFYSLRPKLGKSTLGYYLMAKYPQHFLVLNSPGYAKDVMTTLVDAVLGGWNPYCVIINLPMGYTNLEFFYDTLEAIKDPIWTSSKYKGRSIQKGMTHCIVFANFPPTPYKKGKAIIDKLRIHQHVIPDPLVTDPNSPRKRVNMNFFNDVQLRPEDIEEGKKVLANREQVADPPQIKDPLAKVKGHPTTPPKYEAPKGYTEEMRKQLAEEREIGRKNEIAMTSRYYPILYSKPSSKDLEVILSLQDS